MVSELIGPRIDPGKRQTHVRKVYSMNCSICMFMQKNPDFRRRVMASRYFRPEGTESLAAVVHDYGDPVKLPLVYMHMQRHQPADLLRAKRRFTEARREIEAPLPAEAEVLKSVDSSVLTQGDHERGLDDFIQQGRDLLVQQKMKISATTFLAAVKIRAEIDKSTKDRRLDMIKAFFTGGGKRDQAEDG